MPSIRYAVVGLGHIAQVAVLPAFAHAGRNSRLVAVVSGDRTKRRSIGQKYKVAAFSYEEYEKCLAEVDAVYIALPNSLHAEYTIRAARRGVHVLCEKPMACTVDECEKMIEACRDANVALMIAYRLHFEPLNLEVLDAVRRGRIGEPKFFTSSFGLTVDARNARTRRDMGGGSVFDIGVYCINAARSLFAAEPKEVMAIAVNSGVRRLREIDESTGALLRFEGERVAAFVSSFNSTDLSEYRIVGTRGHLRVEPAYDYAEELEYTLTVNGKRKRKRISRRDHFAAELLYFSDCILKGRRPEPSGEEGMQDVRIIHAIFESADAGKAVTIPPFKDPASGPTRRQRISRPPVRKPRLVKVRSASGDD